MKNTISYKNEYTEENELSIDQNVVKKGMTKELPKFLPNLSQIS